MNSGKPDHAETAQRSPYVVDVEKPQGRESGPQMAQAKFPCDQAGACVVIPVYNHARTVGSVVRGAREYASTVLICDDGSTDGSDEEAERAGGILLRHSINQGKGVALQTLLKEAMHRGFRYAIALDADGQHLPSDLPLLSKHVGEAPGALFIGARNLRDSRAPRSSQFGRRFSNFWVWFESGSRVDDSQCGYRAYPIPETLQLGAKRHHYDFEVEILIRAGWAGLTLQSVPVAVVYPENRVTHFRPFADNARISLHNLVTCIRLLLPLPLSRPLRRIPRRPGLSLFALRRWGWLGAEGPLFRLLTAGVAMAAGAGWIPGELLFVVASAALLGLGALPTLAVSFGLRALTTLGLPPLASAAILGAAMFSLGTWEGRRRPIPNAPKRWTGRSRGGVFGHWFFFQLTRFFGTRAAYLLTYPVSLYFLFVASTARNASRQFLDRAIGPTNWLARQVRTYRHFVSFARTLVDRALLATRGMSTFRCEELGLDYIRSSASEGGVILLTAHLGNWDLAAGLLHGNVADRLTIAAFRGERERLARFLEKNLRLKPRIIEVGSGPFASLEMVRALREGSVLAIQGDRPMDRHVVKVPFLGREAPFPVGPFMLAAVTGAPVVVTFSIQVAPASYRFFAEPPMRVAFANGQGRDTQLRAWTESYVRQLERLAYEHPYQWFNFYDFWDWKPNERLV